MRLLLIPLLFTIAACSPVFKLSTSQGNAIDNEKLAKVEPGMTPDQVRFLLGTPLVVDEFLPRRWDYVSYYRSGDGKERQRVVSLYFENGELARIEDSKPPKQAGTTDEEDSSAS